MTLIKIQDRTLDTSDPCTVAETLRALRLQIAAGGQAETVRFGEEEVRYSPANLALLDREIARFEGACSLATTGRRPRRRYARRIRWD